jgi:hypothetical protein
MHRQIGAQHNAGAPSAAKISLVSIPFRPARIAALPMNGAAFARFFTCLARSLLNRLH